MLDQAGIPRYVEQHLMPDKVEVTRDAAAEVLDPETGQLVPVSPLLVHVGRAGLYARQQRIRNKGGYAGAWVEEVRAGYRMLLPLDAPELSEGDTVRVVEARDGQAVGRTYRVTAMGEVSSVPLVRTVWLEEHNRTGSS